jgi:serine/threonine-protein kinase
MAVALSIKSGAPPESLALHADASRIFEARLGPNNPESIDALEEQASTLEQGRRDAESTQLLQTVISRYEQALGKNTPRLVRPLTNLALILARNDQPNEAVGNLQRAIAIATPTLGPQHDELAEAFATLGSIYANQLGRYADAEKAYTDAQAAIPSGDTRSLPNVLKNLGRLHITMRKADRAEPELQQAFSLLQQSGGEKTAYTWYVGSQWGVALAMQGKLAQAEAIQREALEKVTNLMGKDAYQNSLVIDALAGTLEKKPQARDKDGNKEIVELRRRALSITEMKYPKTSSLWAQRATDLASALIDANAPASRTEALDLLQQAITDLRAKPDSNGGLGQALILRGKIEALGGTHDTAIADLREGLASLQQQLGQPDPAEVTNAQTLLKQLGG